MREQQAGIWHFPTALGKAKWRGLACVNAIALTGLAALAVAPAAHAAISCERQISANVVAFDKPLMYNRLGAGNVNGMMFALKRDVINTQSLSPLTAGGAATPGQLDLRPDKRHRPLVLRVRKGDCLTVNLQNLLTPQANPLNVPLTAPSGQQHTVFIDEQVTGRFVGFHSSGVQLVNSIADDGSHTGTNLGSLVAQGASKSYTVYAEKEGVFNITSGGAVLGSDANMGNSANGLFGQLIVEPAGAKIYRGQLFEEEMRLAADANNNGVLDAAELTATGQPRIRYEATYPNNMPWTSEGKAGLPILNMMMCATSSSCEIVHSEINGVIAGPNADGTFPPGTYPLESVGKRNPTLPNRLEPFRDFASVFHDEVASAQAFPGFYKDDPVFRYVLAGVKDAFMINYGSGGIGSEIIANRLGVGPTSDCADCAYEEFFLTSLALGDPALTVDIPANVGLENILPGQVPPAGTQGPKANFVIGAEDPSNVHHSYIGDFVKFRNTHIGKEQHIFHLHNHQWLFNPNDDNANYLDAQGIGPGVGYTYEINFGGSGNRNKSAGDAIFHCHFYPHFAQGMWYHWRNNDTFATGTKLAASGTGYHTTRWALSDTTPAAGARAYPDGEIVAGTPIPAVVPLPGKPLAVMPGAVQVVQNPLNSPFNGKPLGSLAKVIDRTKNPGYPFWVAGIEDTVGHRPPTPPLDMLSKARAQALKDSGNPLWSQLQPNQADGFDGGLPRHAMKGYAAGATTHTVTSRLDFSKEFVKAVPVYYPEEGTDLEQLAMAFHANRTHPTSRLDLAGNATAASFVTNGGGGPVVGAPFHNPCIDDTGVVLKPNVVGTFFSGETLSGMSTRGSSIFNSDTPRIYKGTNLQFDAVLNKTGYHYPQQRIVALWQDVAPVITKQKPPEPLVMRANTFDCSVYHHSNLVPGVYEIDDYQVRTPTDIIGQHIHLPKWDLTTTDGAANGWNYEDGTMAAAGIRERIQAIRNFNGCVGVDAGDPRDRTGACPVAQDHPYWGKVAAQLGGRFPEEWRGARTTMQRWFTDPVVNTEGVDRGLGIVFTHDHYGPSTHQQIGLYSTLLTEPAGSRWVMNETGQQLGYDPVNGAPARTDTNTDGTQFSDGGPTSWQAAILTPTSAPGGSTVKSETLTAFREFYFEFSDFQHAYEAGVYVGAGQDGLPLMGTGPDLPPVAFNAGNPQFDGATANAFRFAINPPARLQAAPVFPDLVLEVASTANNPLNNFCPSRPCPQAISVSDPGVQVVNYRMEPVALRVFDPNKPGPDGKPGMQADGKPGDLAFALQSRTDRAIAQLNVMPNGNTVINGTRFPPHINAGGFNPGDPFTPMMRAYQGDFTRVKIQAGGHEDEHAANIHGVKWLQGGSGHGTAPNSGWRNSQAAGISEQFTLSAPVLPSDAARGPLADYLYTMNASNDGWWSGMWGLMRTYEAVRPDLFKLPGASAGPAAFANKNAFNGVCPKAAPIRVYNVTAILANDLLDNPLGVTVAPTGPVGTMHVGAPVKPAGGTLVYNHRNTTVAGSFANENGVLVNLTHQGPLHDPTAILYVNTSDIAAGKLKAGAALEPVVIRAAAGDCLQINLANSLPAKVPDLATYSTLQGVVKRDRFGAEGSTTFQTNLIRPSSYVGIHPQMVAMDVTQDDGRLVGANPERRQLAVPGGGTFYRWYVGDLGGKPVNGSVNVVATPVEFGGSNLFPADVIKQGAKSLVGAMVVHPQGSTWVEDTQVLDHQDGVGTRATRAQATVTAGANTFRDFSLVLTKGNTHYYRDGSPVEHMNGEGLGTPEDSQEASGMSLNYGIEPLWFRFGLLPQAPFGKCEAGQTGCYGDIVNPELAYSNTLAGNADPVTPVFQANRNQQTRLHITNPHGTSRGSTFALHGHVWQRDPYVCPGEARNTLTGACLMTSVGSRALGVNPQGFAQSGQESWTPANHYDIFLTGAGGGNGVIGDYLMRDQASFGNASGVWGIMRVK